MNNRKFRKIYLIMIFMLYASTSFSAEYPDSPRVGFTTGALEYALSSDDRYLYGADLYQDRIVKIDTQTNQLVGTLTGITGPWGIAISKDNSKLYVAEYGRWGWNNKVAVINAQTLTLINRVQVGQGPQALSISYDGAYVYVPCVSDGKVHVIDTGSDTVISTITVSNLPRHVAFNRDSSKAYVSHHGTSGNSTIEIIDTTSRSVVGTMDFGIHPFKMTTSFSGKYLYTANWGASNYGGEHTVSIIDLESTPPAEIKRIDVVGNAPYDIDLTGCGGYLLVSLSNWPNAGNKVAVVDLIKQEKVTDLYTYERPMGIAITRDSKKVYISTMNNCSTEIWGAAGCSLGVCPQCPSCP